MVCSPPGSSVHGILQKRILKWVAMPSSRESSWPRNRTLISYVSCVDRQVLYTTSGTWEVMESLRVKGDTEVPYLSAGWTVEPFTEMGSTGIEPGRQGAWGGDRVCKTVNSSLQCCLGLACMCPAAPLHTRKKLLLNFVPLVPLGTSSQISPQLTSLIKWTLFFFFFNSFPMGLPIFSF